MAVQTQTIETAASTPKLRRTSWLESRNVLGFIFMLPAAALLLLFLTYPLGLGLWLGLTVPKIDGEGGFIALCHFISPSHANLFLLLLLHPLLSTALPLTLQLL